jgi:hypothetical protein
MKTKLKALFFPCQENAYRPVLLGSDFLYYFGIFLLILKLAVLPFFLVLPKTVYFAQLTKNSLIELTNKTREKFNLPKLKENPILDQAAYLKAKDMFEKNYFSHYSPQGTSPWYWFKAVGYRFQSAGENLAIGFLDSEEVHQAWLNSSSHRANILNPNYQEIGLAVVKGKFEGNETFLVVQLFATPQPTPTIRPPTIAKEKKKFPEITPKETVKIETSTLVAQEAGISTSEEAEISTPTEILPKPEVLVKEKSNPFVLDLFGFISLNYYRILEKIIYGVLIFILSLLSLTLIFDVFVYHPLEIQYKDIVFKTGSFLLLLVVLIFLDKIAILQTIPHPFRIF